MINIELLKSFLKAKLTIASLLFLLAAVTIAYATGKPGDHVLATLISGQLSTSLLAAALLTLTVELLVRTDSERFVRTSIDDSLTRLTQDFHGIAVSVAKQAAIDAVNTLPALPAQLFPAANSPLPAFEVALGVQLSRSTIYIVKAAKACRTAWRVMRMSDQQRSKLARIVIAVLDPREKDLLSAHAQLTIGRNANESSVDAEIGRIKEDIFLTILAVHRLNDDRVELVLHRDYNFYRCEVFQGGMFLTYYSGGNPFPGTFLFSAQSIVYQAHYADIERLLRGSNVSRLALREPGGDRKTAANLLAEQGFDSDCEKLSKLLDERFVAYDKERPGV